MKNSDTRIYSKRDYELFVSLYNDGTGGHVYVHRNGEPIWSGWVDGARVWWGFSHPAKYFWQRSLQKATIKAIDWVNKRIARELKNEANLDVIKEIVSELPELLS